MTGLSMALFPIKIYKEHLMFECYDYNNIEEKIDFTKFEYELILRNVSSDLGSLHSLRYAFDNEEDFNIFLFEVALNNIHCRFL